MSPSLFSGLVVFVLVLVASAALARAKPKAMNARSGKIGGSWLFRVFGAFAVFMGGIAGYGFVVTTQAAALAAALLLCIGGFWLLYLTHSVFDVSWDEAGVTGPTSASLPPRRITIAWPDVDDLSPTLFGAIRLTTADGRRIYWGTWAAGYRWPVDALLQYRPDLGGDAEGG